LLGTAIAIVVETLSVHDKVSVMNYKFLRNWCRLHFDAIISRILTSLVIQKFNFSEVFQIILDIFQFPHSKVLINSVHLKMPGHTIYELNSTQNVKQKHQSYTYFRD
jgi:hypothetical protein